MTYKKTITIDVYDCPGCGEPLRLAVMKKEGKLCPDCEDAGAKVLTIDYWTWVLGCRVVGIYVADYSPNRIHSIILELPDGSHQRIYPDSLSDMNYSEWEEDMGFSKWVEDESSPAED